MRVLFHQRILVAEDGGHGPVPHASRGSRMRRNCHRRGGVETEDRLRMPLRIGTLGPPLGVRRGREGGARARALGEEQRLKMKTSEYLLALKFVYSRLSRLRFFARRIIRLNIQFSFFFFSLFTSRM